MSLFNQYARIDLPIEEISSIVCKYGGKRTNEMIEDIELGETMPNILIYNVYSINKPNYNNIFPSVKILVTNEYGLKDGLWNNIPDHIEYIIVDGKIYKNNKDKFDFIEFENYEKKIEIIIELLMEGRINEKNINDKTLLYYACRYSLNEISMRIINKMTSEALDIYDDGGFTALYWACVKGLEIP